MRYSARVLCAVIAAAAIPGCRATGSSRAYTDKLTDELRNDLKLRADCVKRTLDGPGGVREGLVQTRGEVAVLRKLYTEERIESAAEFDRVLRQLAALQAQVADLKSRVDAMDEAGGEK